MSLRAKHVAATDCTASWEEAITLHRSLPRLRKQLKEAYNIDNLQMRFKNPWGGPSHTEFTLVVELSIGGTAAMATAVKKWLSDMVGYLLKEYRKAHKRVALHKQERRPAKRKANIRKGRVGDQEKTQ